MYVNFTLMKKISIVSICYNEIDSIDRFKDEVINELKKHSNYDYEIIIADNCSNDGTKEKLLNLAKSNNKIKIIFNLKNYGEEKSAFNAISNASGDIIITLHTDLEEPVSTISKFLKKYEEGYTYVVGQKVKSDENNVFNFFKNIYYFIYNKISDTKLVKNTALIMIDKKHSNIFKNNIDSDPFTRGLLSELLPTPGIVQIDHSTRKYGKSKNNFFSLYNLGIKGLVKFSFLPLRLLCLICFISGFFCMVVTLIIIIAKLTYFAGSQLNISTIYLFVSFVLTIIFFFCGLIGEYIISIFSYLKKTPIVIEEKKINF